MHTQQTYYKLGGTAVRGTKKLVFCALLSALAAVIFKLEALIPLPVSIYGVKLGLSNAVTLFVLFTLGEREAVSVLVCRVLLCFMFAGTGVSLIYSLCGGLASMGICILLKNTIGKPVWFIGAVGAVSHNVGQLAAAALIMHTSKVFFYMPVLTVSGIITGIATGTLANIALKRFKNILK